MYSAKHNLTMDITFKHYEGTCSDSKLFYGTKYIVHLYIGRCKSHTPAIDTNMVYPKHSSLGTCCSEHSTLGAHIQ